MRLTSTGFESDTRTLVLAADGRAAFFHEGKSVPGFTIHYTGLNSAEFCQAALLYMMIPVPGVYGS